MTDLVPSRFVSPSPRSELNGELGLDLHEIAKAMELEFSTVKRKRDELKKANEIDDTTICRIVKTGFIEREENEMTVYTHENIMTGTRCIRLGTQKDGIFIDFYSDGAWGYTVIKDGDIVTSQDFEEKLTFEEVKAGFLDERRV